MDQSESVVGLLGQRISEQVQLLEESEVLQKLNKFVEVSELVVADEQHLQELESAEALDVGEGVFLSVDLFDAEVRMNVVQVP